MNNSTQVVTLDGVAIPLVDPHNFQEFWNEREEERIRDSEKTMMYAEKVQSDSQRRRQRDDAALQSRERRDIETQYPGRNRIGTLSNSASTFDQPQQGAVSYLGEGTLDDTYYQQQQEQQQEQQQRRTIMDMNHRRQQQRQRPQSAQRQRSRQRRGARPASAHSSTRSGPRRSMSKTAPSDSHHRRTKNNHRSRPQSAQPSKRRTRPKSARLSGTTGVGARRTKGGHVIPSGGEEDRRLVLENYQNSIKAQRRIRPTSSSEYIKLRAAKRRQQAKNFAESLKFEEKKRKVEVRAKVKEMNKWVLSNGDDVHYSIVEDVNAGAHGIIIHVRGQVDWNVSFCYCCTLFLC